MKTNPFTIPLCNYDRRRRWIPLVNGCYFFGVGGMLLSLWVVQREEEWVQLTATVGVFGCLALLLVAGGFHVFTSLHKGLGSAEIVNERLSINGQCYDLHKVTIEWNFHPEQFGKKEYPLKSLLMFPPVCGHYLVLPKGERCEFEPQRWMVQLEGYVPMRLAAGALDQRGELELPHFR